MSNCAKKRLSWIMWLCLLSAAGCSEESSPSNTPKDLPCDCTSGENCSTSELESCTNQPPTDKHCPKACPETCDELGKCPANPECPDDCPETCDESGKCPANPECPDDCPETCDESGKCPCPETCKTSCNDNGVCQCPASCKDSCDAKGECVVMCGDEIVQKIYFSYTELDILAPGSTARSIADMTVYIQTDKKTYNMETAPCKSDIVLSIDDESIATVAQNTTTPKNARFTAVKTGKTRSTASLKGHPEMKGTITIRVLNLDRLHESISYKDESNKYIHLYKKPLKLIAKNQVSQGFDFYTTDFMYFTQLPEIDVTKTKDGKIEYSHTQLDIFQNDYKKNSASMKFPASGHGQNLIAEHIGEKDYLWFASYGTLECTDNNTKCTDGYKRSQTIARVDWDISNPNQLIYPSDIKDHYYLSDKTGESFFHSFEPAIDVKNNTFSFRATYDKDHRTYVKTYHLSDVKKLGTSTVKLQRPIQWINKNNEFITGYTPTITVKDFSTLKPIHEFDKKRIAIQGMELENSLIYTVGDARALLKTLEGNDKQYEYRSEISIYIYTYGGKSVGGAMPFHYDKLENGNEYIYHLTTVDNPVKNLKKATVDCKNETSGKCTGYYMDNTKLDGLLNFTENGIQYKHNGYVEAEGIRVMDGKLYISATVKYNYIESGKKQMVRRQAILVYDLLR